MADMMSNLIRVAGIPSGSKDYIESVVKFYNNSFEDSIPEYKQDRVSYTDSGAPMLPWKQASDLMLAQLAVKKRLEYGR